MGSEQQQLATVTIFREFFFTKNFHEIIDFSWW